MKNNSPYQNIQIAEFEKSFYSYCTFIALLHDKKMNFATVFLKILEDRALRDIFVSIIEEENDFTAIRKYIQTEPSVTKSKYVTKFLNKLEGFND